ncbi:MAG: hypothetical protein WBH51_11605 [Mycolicibacter algericus]|uniref:hypothetical protein n=1 Tax=Mycolicibacter algericus TaxID=1288388 RepID=UPI003C751BF2
MTLSNGWPSLSEVRAASWDYLKASGESWSRLADTWENAFAEVRNASVRPGGTVWDGRAAHRMQERTAADAVTVRTPADQLRLAAEIARRCCGRQEVGAIAGAGAAMLASNGVEMAWGPVTDSVGSVARGAKSLFGFG